MFETYPGKKGPVNPSDQTGQTSPGLKTKATGLVSKSFSGKSGNGGFNRPQTASSKPGTTTYPKSGARQKKSGTDITDGYTAKGACCNLGKTPKAM